jgi:hypothetical protein
MTNAIDLVNNPELDITPLTTETSTVQAYSNDEIAHFRIGHDDIKNLILNIYGFGGVKGKTVKTDIRPAVIDAVFEDSIDKSNTFTLTVHDPDWELLNTGALQERIDLNPGKIKNLWYRLDSVQVNDNELTLVFSTRNAVFLSYHRKPFKANRKHVTRAEFILTILRKVHTVKIPYHIPQLHVVQPLSKRTETQIEALHHRHPGFTASDKLTVKHHPANQIQRDCISEVIRAGLDDQAPGPVIVAAIMCVIGESAANTDTKGSYTGAFQQDSSWPATGNVYKDARGNGKLNTRKGGFYGIAIPQYRKNPNVDLGYFIQTVQAAFGPSNVGYAGGMDRWRDEAEHAYHAYNGTEEGPDPGSGQVEVIASYEFIVGQPPGHGEGIYRETYLAAIYRLADVVNWSFFWVRDTAYYMSQEDLFKSKARARLRRGVHGVESVNFEWDRGKKFTEMTLQVRMDRWVCPIGTTVMFDEGGPAEGKWLVTNIRRSMFDELGEITLSKPIKEKNEPIEKTTKNVATGGGAGGSTGNVPDTMDWAYPLEVRGTVIGKPNVIGSTHDPTQGAGPGGYLWQDDNAVDIAVPVGTKEYAVDDGTIFNVGGSYTNGSGRYEGLKFSIRTKNNEVFYQHSSWRAPWVVNGAKVSKGDFVAKTGRGNGVAHLHFACKNGNPMILLGFEGGGSGSGHGVVGVWPGRYHITSPYGEDRPDHTHAGCDVGVPYNTRCTAPFDGLITFVEESGFGTAGGMVHLMLETAQAGLHKGQKIGWGHCHNAQVHVGQHVKKGQIVAYSDGSPAHVHFILQTANAPVVLIDGNADPTDFLYRIGSIFAR